MVDVGFADQGSHPLHRKRQGVLTAPSDPVALLARSLTRLKCAGFRDDANWISRTASEGRGNLSTYLRAWGRGDSILLAATRLQ